MNNLREIVDLPYVINFMKEVIVKDHQVFEKREYELYDSWEPIPEIKVIKQEPWPTWKGGLITFELWAQIISFLRWTQKEFAAESLVTLFYHKETKQWRAWAFPQEPHGMTIKHLPEHALYAQDRAQFGRGWVQLGSIHHHCTAVAFQSGTDTADEINRDGIHITIGKLEDKELDLHARQVFSQQQSVCGLHHWIAMPDWMIHVPPVMQYELYIKMLKTIDNTPQFPAEWKKRIIEKEVVAVKWNKRTKFTSESYPYRMTCRSVMRKIIGNLKLTAEEALALLMETTASKLTPEKWKLRSAIVRTALENHIPTFWPEELLDEIIYEDDKNNKAEQLAFHAMELKYASDT